MTIKFILVLGFAFWLAVRCKHHLQRLGEIVMTVLLADFYPIKSSSDGRNLPGPRWKWIDGQTIDKFLCGRDCSEKWRHYGTIYRIWSGTVPEVVISRPEDIREFHSDSNLHQKAKSSNAGWLFHQLLGDCLGLVNGLAWKRLRAEFGPSFTQPFIMSRIHVIEEQAKSFVEGIPAKSCARLQNEKTFAMNVAELVAKFPFFCTAEHLYGPLEQAEKQELWSIGQMSLGLMGHVLSGGIMRFAFAPYFDRKLGRSLERFRSHWLHFNEKMYESRYNQSSPPPIVPTWALVENGQLRREQVLQTLSEILFANLDVSTGVFSWLIYFLAKDRAIQDQLREEIEQSQGDVVGYCSRRLIRSFQAFSIPEYSPNEKLLGGFLVPPKTSVVIDTISANLNTEIWGDDSQEFRPARFQSLKPTDIRYSLFVFGFGTRKCLGQHLGELMVKLFVVHLLRRYEVTYRTASVQSDSAKESHKTWVPISDVHVDLTRL